MNSIKGLPYNPILHKLGMVSPSGSKKMKKLKEKGSMKLPKTK